VNLLDDYRHDHLVLTEDQATALSYCREPGYTVEVHPPVNKSVPKKLVLLIRGIQEIQSKWLGLVNVSPVISFEIRRVAGQLHYQFSVPTKRLERKLRNHLANQVDGVGFSDGYSGLPVAAQSEVGGGFLTAGRNDYFPFQTSFDTPPANALASTLHKHAMQNTDVVIQILFQPVIGHPVKRRWWRKKAYRQIGFLKKEKEKLWGRRAPTQREKRQANKIEDKAGSNRFYTSIRFIVVGAGEYTASRVKELVGAFNVYENPETGQYLNLETLKPFREKSLFSFCNTVSNRVYGKWGYSFQTTVDELSGLVSIPSRQQDNIQYSQ